MDITQLTKKLRRLEKQEKKQEKIVEKRKLDAKRAEIVGHPDIIERAKVEENDAIVVLKRINDAIVVLKRIREKKRRVESQEVDTNNEDNEVNKRSEKSVVTEGESKEEIKAEEIKTEYYCSQCGEKLSIFDAKNQSKDSPIMCASCLTLEKRKGILKILQKEQENRLAKKIMEKSIYKYLTQKDEGFDRCLEAIYDEFESGKIRFKNVSQGEEYIDESAVYEDVKSRQTDKGILDFLLDLKKMHELFKNRGIATNYFEILSIFLKVREVIKKRSSTIEVLEGMYMARGGFQRKQRESAGSKIIGVEIRGAKRSRFLRTEFKRKKKDIGLSNNFSNYSSYEFEKLIGNLFEAKGYNVKVTPPARDYGVDVIAKKGGNIIAIQVKKYGEKNRVGVKDVQQALGAMYSVKATKSILITTSNFTGPCQEQAKGAPIELWDKERLHKEVMRYIYPTFANRAQSKKPVIYQRGDRRGKCN